MPICGEALIVHVIRTLGSLPDIARIRIVMEPEAHSKVSSAIAPVLPAGLEIEFVPSQPNIVDSMIAGAGDDDGPFIITTADNVLLTADAVAQMRAALQSADGAIGVTTKERVLAAHPEGQRRFYEFKDAGYANCNLYGLANRRAFAAAEMFREGGQFQANPGRMIRAFGLFNILSMWLGWVSFATGFQRVSKRFGVSIAPLTFEDGALTIDVDNERTYDCCETIMKQRQGQST